MSEIKMKRLHKVRSVEQMGFHVYQPGDGTRYEFMIGWRPFPRYSILIAGNLGLPLVEIATRDLELYHAETRDFDYPDCRKYDHWAVDEIRANARDTEKKINPWTIVAALECAYEVVHGGDYADKTYGRNR